MENDPRERIGIFGGSFDPIHVGHLILASDAVEQMNLDRVLFVPAAQAPLKTGAPAATATERVEMIEAAIIRNPRFECCDLELNRNGTSYSIDTANAIASAHPNAKLFWIIGGDQARKLAQWREIGSLAERVEFICLGRQSSEYPGESPPPNVQIQDLKERRIDLSSTEIRERIKTGKPFKYFLPDGVFRYIKSRNLYQDLANAT